MMPESLPIAIALVAVAVAAWDTCRHYMQLAHGRMMAADKALAFERELTAQSTRITVLSDAYSTLQDVALTGRKKIDDLEDSLRHTVGEATWAHHDAANNKRMHDIEGSIENLIGLHVSDASWQRKAEQTFEKLSADINTRDRAITNVAEEVVKLKEQMTMAVAGVARMPKTGFGRSVG